MEKKTILVVDDELEVSGMIKDSLEILGYSVLVATSKVEALELSVDVDLVLQDIILDGWGCNGLDLLKQYKEVNQLVKVVMITGYMKDINWPMLDAAGAMSLWKKPFGLSSMSKNLERIFAEE